MLSGVEANVARTAHGNARRAGCGVTSRHQGRRRLCTQSLSRILRVDEDHIISVLYELDQLLLYNEEIHMDARPGAVRV